MGKRALFLALAALLMQSFCHGAIQKLQIEEDGRYMIDIDNFGFKPNGKLEIQLSDVRWKGTADAALNPALMGFFLATQEDWLQVKMEMDLDPACVLDKDVHILFTLDKLDSNNGYNGTFNAPGGNRYNLMFANCHVSSMVWMNVRTSMYNLDGNTKDYLPEGETQLPVMFFSFFVIYVALGVLWVYVCLKQKETAHRIHILMGVVIVLKALYMFSEAEDKAYVKKTGTAHGWDIAFYAFSFLKGIMLFTVIVLIGTGWSFLKPYLQDKEKKVLMLVIPLQVLANLAFAVIGEAGPSAKDWTEWQQLLLFVDVVCCCAILFPIVWSIRHLREAARSDGKAARNLVKLTLFRQYYVVVVSYIYFTRIVVFAFSTITSYHYTWVSELSRELVTLAFYVFTGYKFRPVAHNPYFVLDDDEEAAAAEEALKDDDFEL